MSCNSITCKDCEHFKQQLAHTDNNASLYRCECQPFIVGEKAKACDKYEAKSANE